MAAERSNKPYATDSHPPPPPSTPPPPRLDPAGHQSEYRRHRQHVSSLPAGRSWMARRGGYHDRAFGSWTSFMPRRIMAKDMEWYSRPSVAISRRMHWDDLVSASRWPMKNHPRSGNRARQVSTPWVYAITRQETLLAEPAPDGLAPLGLMQLNARHCQGNRAALWHSLRNPNVMCCWPSGRQ